MARMERYNALTVGAHGLVWAATRPHRFVIAFAVNVVALVLAMMASAVIGGEALAAVLGANSLDAALAAIGDAPARFVGLGIIWIGLVHVIARAGTLRAVLERRGGLPAMVWGDEARLASGWLLATLLLAGVPALLYFGGAFYGEAVRVERLGDMLGAGGLLISAVAAYRFALVGAASVSRGGFGLASGWGASTGYFWSLIATQVVTTVLVAAVGLAIALPARAAGVDLDGARVIAAAALDGPIALFTGDGAVWRLAALAWGAFALTAFTAANAKTFAKLDPALDDAPRADG